MIGWQSHPGLKLSIGRSILGLKCPEDEVSRAQSGIEVFSGDVRRLGNGEYVLFLSIEYKALL